jgi:hypothetical protein
MSDSFAPQNSGARYSDENVYDAAGTYLKAISRPRSHVNALTHPHVVDTAPDIAPVLLNGISKPVQLFIGRQGMLSANP